MSLVLFFKYINLIIKKNCKPSNVQKHTVIKYLSKQKNLNTTFKSGLELLHNATRKQKLTF